MLATIALVVLLAAVPLRCIRYEIGDITDRMGLDNEHGVTITRKGPRTVWEARYIAVHASTHSRVRYEYSY